jgi:hypothetical protein
MTLLFLVPALASRPRGPFRLGMLALGLAGCLPLPNDLGDTSSSTTDPTDGVETSLEPTDDTGPGPAPGSTTDDGVETSLEPTDDTGPAFGSSTDAGDTEGDTEGDTDGKELPGAFQCVLDEPCITSYFGCTSHFDNCESEPLPEWGEGSICVLELFRDIASMPGTSVEVNFERGGSPDWTWTELTYVLQSDGTVIYQGVVHDDKFGSDIVPPMQRCEVQAPEYFQACLDTPSWDCAAPGYWMTNCVEIEELECPGP